MSIRSSLAQATHGGFYFLYCAFALLAQGIHTDDPTHPHYSVYDFKRRFGGREEAVASGSLVLSRAKHAFQERFMMPAWKRFYPLYLRLTGARPAPAV